MNFFTKPLLKNIKVKGRRCPDYNYDKTMLISLHYYNLGQNIVNKLTKLSKIGYSMEYFTADFLQFSSSTIKIYLMRDRLSTQHQFQAFQ